MGKIAFVFSGQGAQYTGMGKELYESSQAVKKLFDEAEAYRPGTKNQCFFGTAEELKDTKNTQPCLYLVGLGAALALEEKGIKPTAVAGFSLGELCALAYANAFSYLDGFEIVTHRGNAMAQSAVEHDTAMYAVVKLDSNTVDRATKEFDGLYAVNFNCPGQTVVSGAKASFNAFEQRIKELGGKCVPLSVSAAFHSPYMEKASEAFANELKRYNLSKPWICGYSNLTAQPYGDNVAEYLKRQMKSPVMWEKTITNMMNDGYDIFIEVGAGKTLCGLIKKISCDARVFNVQDKSSLMDTVSEVTRLVKA